MTTLFQRTTNDWRDIGGLETAEEIAHQPALWRELAAHLGAEQSRIAAFLGDSLRNPQQRVILTGAGSSAYVGEIIADEINAAWPCQVRAISTTSLLTHPALYLDSSAPTLLVSFARSGNSPESTGAVQLVRDLVPNARFLNITCNAEGDLAQQGANDSASLNLMMPAASCDRGFAMTSSFTCMLLAALSALDPDFQPERLNKLAQLGEQAQGLWSAPVAALAARRVSRVIYLGSGPLEALAKEAALKIMELTAGSVMTMANSALGFRHGPKAAVNPETLVLLFRSADPLSRRYEHDLVEELRRDQVAADVLTVGAGGDFSIDTPAWPDAWLAPLWLLMAQQYALHQSALLQLRPDNPFKGGIVNRVVQGVTIYRHDEF
ncbi:galactosamine 6-phosphate isomerase AgaS [Duganella sacchari]|uniref:Galactosamine 6-phosphate isomerase AgaS n=1 Tax=Duganella sacchari TaxID=551987 RepID=A0A1M7QP12_9BURK|nr:SIS domain-containing protein [Duganella sacchari]SHN33274.1 galactosamine 6-phosphate isomerase AgaS [Duganella sacchari]